MHDEGESRFCFTANSSRRTTCGFDTLRAHDEAEYQLCEHEHRLDGPFHAGGPYRGSLLLTEARLSMGGCYKEALLSMAAGYIYLRLCDSSSGVLKSHIPYCYKRGRFHGRHEGTYRRWDMRLDADGREKLVEELERRIWAYEEQRLESLLTQWDAGLRSCIYFLEESGGPNSRTHIVFSDKGALERVRFRSFLEDCRAIEQPDDSLQEAIDVERALLTGFIAVEHADVMSCYEPKVVRLPQRYRV